MDGFLSVSDILAVIDNLSARDGDGEGEAEGESDDGLVSAASLSSELLVSTTPPAGESQLGATPGW